MTGTQLHSSKSSVVLLVITAFCMSPALYAQQTATTAKPLYSAVQADRGKQLFQTQCASCHGANLTGALAPPLTGPAFTGVWAGKPLGELAAKIQKTMPPDESGKITLPQATDIVAHILRTTGLPAGTSTLAADEKALSAMIIPGKSAASAPASFPPAANLAQMMRGILFPSSNMVFNVQTHDPGEPLPKAPAPGQAASQSFSWVDWGAGIYKGWDIVDYAALAVADSAPLMLTPGRRCENGRPVPVDRPDWIKFTLEMAEAGRAAYRASQTRSQEAVSDSSNQLADSCLHCHEVYRDKRARIDPNSPDPSNKAARCQ